MKIEHVTSKHQLPPTRDLHERIQLHLDGLDPNKLGRPTSSAKVTIVPVGPVTQRTVLGCNVIDLAAFACSIQHTQ